MFGENKSSLPNLSPDQILNLPVVTKSDFYVLIDMYNLGTPEQIQAAIKAITNFMDTSEAWTVAQNVLKDNNKGYTRYFVASVLKNKMCHDYVELPSESYSSWKDFFLEYLKKIPFENPKSHENIIPNLSQALAALYIQHPQNVEIIGEILNYFDPKEELEFHSMVHSLRALAKEFFSHRYMLSGTKGEFMQSEFARHFSQVIDIFYEYYKTHDKDTKYTENLLYCIGEWLKNPDLCADQFVKHALFDSLCRMLRQTAISIEVYRANCCVFQNGLNLAKDRRTNRELAKAVRNGICRSYGVFPEMDAKEKEKSSCLARIYVQFAETYLNDMVKRPYSSFGCTEALYGIYLMVKHKEHGLFSMTLDIWLKLIQLIHEDRQETRNEMAIKQFQLYFEKLALFLPQHLQLPYDFQGILNENDEFIQFRNKCGLVLVNSMFMIGKQHVVEMARLLAMEDKAWNEKEAALFIIFASLFPYVQYGLDINDISFLIPSIVATILDFKLTSPLVLLKTSIQVLGLFGHWLGQYHEDGKFFNWLFLMARNTQLVETIDYVIQYICRINRGNGNKFGKVLTYWMEHRASFCNNNQASQSSSSDGII